jgi:hypothetical protein
MRDLSSLECDSRVAGLNDIRHTLERAMAAAFKISSGLSASTFFNSTR